MTMRCKLLGGTAIWVAAAALLPTVVLAVGFTRPVGLPSTGRWLFALNDRGHALAASGNLVYPVDSSGRLGRPWRLTAPGGLPAYVGSIVLDDSGRVAAGLLYSDNTREGGYHEAGCCAHVGVASWLLGARPPVVQVLQPATDNASYANGALGVPEVVIGPTAVTALWSAGGIGGYGSGPIEANLDEAFGPFGGPLQIRQMMSVPRGIQSVHLALDRTGDPVAAWRDDINELHSARGLSSGVLPSASPARRIPGIARGGEEEAEVAEGNEFSSDRRGDTVFAYVPGPFELRGRLMTMTSVDGGRFSAPRTIARAGREHNAPNVVAGGHRSLLAFWSCIAETRECSRAWGRRAGIFGPLGAPFEVGGEPEGLIDSHGGSVVAYDGNSAIEAITAQPGKLFGRPRHVSPSGRECLLGTGGDDEPPPAASQNGAAIFYYTCDGYAHSYLVRYAP
jgi:hypothetical protein